jgi:CBS domain-containing protein
MAHHFKTGAALPSAQKPHTKVADLMVRSVITTLAHHNVGHVKQILKKNHILAIPVVDPEGHAVGIITSTDLIAAESDLTPVGNLMTRKVFRVPQYEDPSTAARIMRNHGIHHVIVTDEGKLVGILSSFDLLKLIEDRRFTARNAPTPPRRGRSARKRSELD